MDTILIVGREPIFPLNFISRQLAGRFRLLITSSPVEAIDLCREHSEIDLLICDVDQEVISGMELVSLLRAWLPALTAIFISDVPLASWTTWQRIEFTNLPGDSFEVLHKPFTSQALDKALNQLDVCASATH